MKADEKEEGRTPSSAMRPAPLELSESSGRDGERELKPLELRARAAAGMERERELKPLELRARAVAEMERERAEAAGGGERHAREGGELGARRAGRCGLDRSSRGREQRQECRERADLQAEPRARAAAGMQRERAEAAGGGERLAPMRAVS